MARSLPWQLRKRFFCTEISKPLRHHNRRGKWAVKQVTRSNFQESLEEFKSHISSSDFVAVSLHNTGSYSAPWHRVSPIDTLQTAYCKVKYAAERFQILQFAVCPFSLQDSKVVAHPYNFHLFPRDELKTGMPSYAFSCQSSFLTSMAQEGFDFNSCIYEGISYLSREQESIAKVQIGSQLSNNTVATSSTTPSVADTVFVERIRTRIKHWKQACSDSSKRADDALIKSLRSLVLGIEEYRSRPCMTIDVCSERQVQLVLEMVGEFSDDLVPLTVPAKGGGPQAVRVVLTSSREDKDLLEKELEMLEEERNKKIRGFREVIDLISTSQRPVVSHDSLRDFTFVHTKFLAPMPSNVDEFMCSLRLVFPQVLDVNHLMNKIGPLRKATNTAAALSYLKNRFFAAVDMEIPSQDFSTESSSHGHKVIEICHLFAKLCSILKITPNPIHSEKECLNSALQEYVNIFNPFSITPLGTVDEEDVQVWMKNTRKTSCNDVVLLWGFRRRMTAGELKSLLRGSHDVFSSEFDVRMVDKSCAIVVFWQPGLSAGFLDVMANGEIGSYLREMVSEGLKAASYNTYRRVCDMGLWEADLADSLDKALVYAASLSEADSEINSSEIHWCSDSIINLDDL